MTEAISDRSRWGRRECRREMPKLAPTTVDVGGDLPGASDNGPPQQAT